MGLLVIMRHGQSAWNRDSRFTGWIDAPLTELGEAQAHDAGIALRRVGISFDVAYTSILSRAFVSLWKIQLAIDQPYLPVVRTWRLNDRHYGALTGKSKSLVRDQYGTEQFQRWRRGYFEAPPPIDEELQKEVLDRLGPMGLPSPEEMPQTESLGDTWKRLRPMWCESIAPALSGGKRVLIVAHGNALRSLVKHIDGIGDDEIEHVEMTHGHLISYEFDKRMRVQNTTTITTIKAD